MDSLDLPLPLPTIPAKRTASGDDGPSIPLNKRQGSCNAKRKANTKAASKANKAARPTVKLTKKARSEHRLTARLERDATVVRMDSPAGSLKSAASGFSGSRVDPHEMTQLLAPSRITETLQSFLPVEFKYMRFSLHICIACTDTIHLQPRSSCPNTHPRS